MQRGRVIGLIGGLSWESSAQYYRLINEGVRARRGGLHSARCLLWSFDFAEIEALQRADRWAEAAALMVEAGRGLKRGGAEVLVICSNTMHLMAEAVETGAGLPLLHIADAAAARIKASHLRRVGLIGTAFTMEQAFYKARLTDRHGLEVVIPGEADRAEIHRIIYQELVVGRVEPSSRAAYLRIIADLVARGAEGVVLGCTEIMLLLRPQDCSVPLFDTTALHAEAAVTWALAAD